MLGFKTAFSSSSVKKISTYLESLLENSPAFSAFFRLSRVKGKSINQTCFTLNCTSSRNNRKHTVEDEACSYNVEYLRHKMTATVTKQNKSCLKLGIVKKTCPLQTQQASFCTMIWTKRFEKLPKMHNETLLVTQTWGAVKSLVKFQVYMYEIGLFCLFKPVLREGLSTRYGKC